MEVQKMDHEAAEGRESLRIPDGCIFSRVMHSPELCRGLLERVFPEMEISRIEYRETEGIYSPTEAEGGFPWRYTGRIRPRFAALCCRCPGKRISAGFTGIMTGYYCGGGYPWRRAIQMRQTFL